MSETKTVAQASAGLKAVQQDGERTIRFISTAPTLDRDLEVIDSYSIQVPVKPKGLKYLADMTATDEIDLPFLIDHDWRLEKQAGSIKSMFINAEGETETVVKLSTVDNGERVYTLAKEGHLGNAFSIGYSLQNATMEEGVIKNIELTEISAVFKGSNRSARLLEVKSVKGETMAEATEEPKVEEVEKPVVTEETVVETPKTEETTVVEEPVKEEETVVEEEKTNEETKMTKPADMAVKSVVPVAELPTQETATKKIDKVDFAAKQFTAWVNKDFKALSELNQQALDSYANASGTKATYLNTAITADGGAIVPSAELLADVYTLLDNYSTVANDLRVITLTEGDSLDVSTLLADVVLTEVTTEGGNKPVTKPTFGDGNIALREFAGIAILTKKLVRQAAVNVYEILRESFARAIANERAEMALTDATSGITNKAGVVEVTGDLTWSVVRSMPYSVPTAAVAGAKYYISREVLAELDQATDTQGRDLDVVTLDGDGLSGRFKNGFRFAVEEVLGKNGNPHVVFGSMSRFGILLRQGTVESETFDQGTVVDGSSVTHNLIQQNKLAHRVAFYENVGFPLPGAFAVATGALPVEA